jgi:hypothetical protein
MEAFDWGGPAHMECKPFTPEELERMWFHYSRTLLDALAEGVVLHDEGGWATMTARFGEAQSRGILERRGTAWEWHREREPADSPRLKEERRLRETWRARGDCPIAK